MNMSAEKFVAAGKASIETGLQAASAASASLFSAVERLSSLNRQPPVRCSTTASR